MLQEVQDDAKSTKHIDENTNVNTEKTLLLRKERGTVLIPEVFVSNVQTIQ